LFCKTCPGVNRVKDGLANKDREKQGYEIHSDAEEKGLIATNGDEGSFPIHGLWILFSKGY